MSKYAWIIVLLALVAPAAADNAVPDLRGTWKGESQSIVLGGTPHHPEQKTDQPRLTSVAFTLVIDKQDGRRFSGTFSSARHSETVIGDGVQELDADDRDAEAMQLAMVRADPT
jgi:hypothetical protein